MHAGATLGKGLNRALATFVAGALGVGAHHLAVISGETGEPILLGFFVFLLGNYSRTFPDSPISGMLIDVIYCNCLLNYISFASKKLYNEPETV